MGNIEREIGNAGADEVERNLDVLEPFLTSGEAREYLWRQLASIVLRLFRTVRNSIDVGRLESALQSEVKRDFSWMRHYLDLLDRLTPADFIDGDAEFIDDVRSQSQRARESIAFLSENMNRLTQLQIELTHEYHLDRAFSLPARKLRRPHAIVDEVVKKSAVALESMPLEHRAAAWSHVTDEVDFSGENPRDALISKVPLSSAIVARDFFEEASSADLSMRLARYYADFRPQLLQYGIDQGQEAFPFPYISLSKLLSSRVAYVGLSSDEREIANRINLLANISRHKLGLADTQLGEALGIDAKSRILGVPHETDAKALKDDTVYRVVASEMKVVLTYVRSFLKSASEPEMELLIRYKLMKEVFISQSHEDLSPYSEVELQQILCAFLLGYGRFAVGTKFGGSQTDLMTGDTANPLLIEVKVFRDSPNIQVLSKSFVQLRSYMDQVPFRSRGALVLFNFSDVPIVAPKEIVDRVGWIAVNLCRATPSKRSSIIHVSYDASAAKPLSIVRVGDDSTSRRAPPTRSSKGTTPGSTRSSKGSPSPASKKKPKKT